MKYGPWPEIKTFADIDRLTQMTLMHDGMCMQMFLLCSVNVYMMKNQSPSASFE